MQQIISLSVWIYFFIECLWYINIYLFEIKIQNLFHNIFNIIYFILLKFSMNFYMCKSTLMIIS